tara:strand:- start:3165 stop:3806 length:642 start_codon:yes stop_codon:yes gene_type:complete
MLTGDATRRSRLAALCLASLSVALMGCVVPDDLHTGRASLGLGYRRLSDDSFGRLGDQLLLRIDGDFRRDNWPVAISTSLGLGTDSYEESRSTCLIPFFVCSERSVTMSSQTVDLSLGARIWRGFEASDVRWFAGTGTAYVQSSLDRYLGNFTKANDGDSSIGQFVEVGISWPTGIGEFTLQWRSFLGTETKLFGVGSSNDFDEIGIYVQKTW